ncbi:MAG: terpene cyclase/mutase family protein [Pirellulaceae bacterium]|nr:terpene cyclase/mutase family protein [Pirellulaceae bacterium]
MLRSISEFLSQPIAGFPVVGWHLVFLAFAVGMMVVVAVIFRKQWAQTPAVWKCVILSGFAHVLLLAIAYSTQYVVVAGAPPKGEGTPIRIVDFDPAIPRDDQESSPRVEFWEKFTGERPAPVLEILERPREEPEFVIERVWEAPTNENAAMEDAPLLITQVPNLAIEALTPENIAPTFGDFSPPKPELSIAPTPTPIERTFEEAVAETAELAAEEPPPLPIQEFADIDPPLEFRDPPMLETTPVAEAPLPEIDREFPLAPLNPIPSQLAAYEKPPTVEPAIPRRFGDSQPMPKIYSYRAPEGRLKIVEQQGGSFQTEQAVEQALAYMASSQSADGRWSSRLTGGGIERNVLGQPREGAGSQADCGITGLALLCYLAAGHNQFEGQYKQTVTKGLQFLSDHQQPDGCLAGKALHFEKTYCHSMALLALGEALAMTGDPRLIPIVRRGVEYSVRSQNNLDGGWRYQPGDAGDMSQFGWKVLALHSASLGGLEIPQPTLNGMHRFLDKSTRGQFGGLGSYRPGDMHSPTMTAEALACRYLLHEHIRPETIDEAMNLIMQNPPTETEVNYYYWYYATMAAHHAGGKHWTNWNERLKPVLLNHQIRTGPEAGSFPADGLWSGYGGKIYSTAMATLCLQAYYRYLTSEDLKAR